MVVLREVTAADLETLYEQQADPVANHMAAFPARDRDAFMTHWTKILSDEPVRARAIVVDGVVAGNLVFFGPPGQREVGYWLGGEFWGRGIATAALAAFLAEIEERPLFAHVVADNAGSIRVLEKCGFVEVERVSEFFAQRGGDAEAVILRLADHPPPA